MRTHPLIFFRRHHTADAPVAPHQRGQSMVEFALVLPILLVLLLGLADFGRVFTAGIALEAAARNGAEAAAQQYVQMARNRPSGVLASADYEALHDIASGAVCSETRLLPEHAASGSTCTMPATAVCIHDASGADPAGCGAGGSSAPGECTALHGAWNAGNVGPPASGGRAALAYVEVRTCYRFRTLVPLSGFDLPFGWGLDLGDVFLQRTRTFSVACYWTSTGTCG